MVMSADRITPPKAQAAAVAGEPTLTAAFESVIGGLRDQPLGVGLALAQQWQDRLAGVEAELFGPPR